LNSLSIKDLLTDTPVIAAVKDDAGLFRALQTECKVVFLLYGSIVNIDELVRQIHFSGKLCFIHIDLIEGLSNREVAVDGLRKLCHPDGIISTRSALIRRAQQLGLCTILRVFMLDSMSLANLFSQLEREKPDFVEVLPGIIPNVIQEITEKTTIPLIAGGLIRNKQDVIQALRSGVVAVSTSSPDVWEL